MGASVDKIEEPSVGDYARVSPPMVGDDSAFFVCLNRNKRSAAVDLKRPEGVAAILGIIDQYDVVVESFRPGVMARLGLGYDVLSAKHPGLIYCALTGWGQTGPHAQAAGHDIGYCARAGVLALTGAPSSGPAHLGVQVADIGGALFAVIGITSALYARQNTGRGRFVDVALADAATAFAHIQLGPQQALGDRAAVHQPGKNALDGGASCYGLYQAQDGRWLAVGSLEPKFFAKLCVAVGAPELADGGFDPATRPTLERIFKQRPAQAWVTLLAPHDVCVELVQEPAEVPKDPQLASRKLFAPGVLRTPLAEVEPRAAPRLGQHTGDILLRR
jgi:alpha-methylacyl-CoA racemase